MDQLCKVGVAFFLMLSALLLTLLALLTDNWYTVHTDPSLDPALRQRHNYHFGLWRLCYDTMPADMMADTTYPKEGSSCIFIFRQLLQKNERHLDKDTQLRLHLSRTVLGCSISSAACCLFALLALLCGVWPSSSSPSSRRQGCVFLSTAILLFFAALSGIASGVSFIAVRDLDNTVVRPTAVMPPVVPPYAHQAYDWSFMSHWVATGFLFLDSLFVLCLLRTSYQVVEDQETFKLKAMDSF